MRFSISAELSLERDLLVDYFDRQEKPDSTIRIGSPACSAFSRRWGLLIRPEEDHRTTLLINRRFWGNAVSAFYQLGGASKVDNRAGLRVGCIR
jgi:hypothetical protein